MFGSLIKAAANIAITPVTAVADVLTSGGIATDEDQPYSVTALENAAKNVGKALDDIA